MAPFFLFKFMRLHMDRLKTDLQGYEDRLYARYSSKAWKVLTSLQNNYYTNQDIITMTASMDEKELLQYVNNKLTSRVGLDFEFYSLLISNLKEGHIFPKNIIQAIKDYSEMEG
mgnify:FL=1